VRVSKQPGYTGAVTSAYTAGREEGRRRKIKERGGGGELKPLGFGSASLSNVAGSAVNSCILIQHASVQAV